MPLNLLPDLVFPVTAKQSDPMMNNAVQLWLDAGVTDQDRKAMDIAMDTYEVLAKTVGAVDYTGLAGHRRLFQDAEKFSGRLPFATQAHALHACHLAIDYNNVQRMLATAGLAVLPNTVPELLSLGRDLRQLDINDEALMGLYIAYLKKK